MTVPMDMTAETAAAPAAFPDPGPAQVATPGEPRLAPYGLRLDDRMRKARFNPEFLFPGDGPQGRRVLLALPHPHEAAKISGLIRVLLAPDARGAPANEVHAVVAMPSHRSITATEIYRRREDLIDAANKEGLDWAFLIGLNLGLPNRDRSRRLRDLDRDLPTMGDYPCRRTGDQFIYGPRGAYRFFNAWHTYDSGEDDPNEQRVDPRDQDEFAAFIDAEDPDIVLLPDHLDPHPSHRTTRELVLEGLRRMLARRHAAQAGKPVTLMEFASFQLLTPPRYNLWVMAPKEIAEAKTEANRAFRLKKDHDYGLDQVMAERVVSIAAGDEFHYTRTHGRGAGLHPRLSRNAPADLPANITAENYTVSRLAVEAAGGIPIVIETRLDRVCEHFESMRP